MTMQVVSLSDFQDAIYHVGYRNREPIMGWGKPGVGKSKGTYHSVVKHLTLLGLTFSKTDIHLRAGRTKETTCARYVDCRLSQYDSVDLRGIPVPDENKKRTVWYAPLELPFKGNPNFSEDDVPIYLVLDEINSAIDAVSAVAYQLINDRRIGENELMDNVVIIALGNREQDRGVVNRQPLPLSNRFTHYEVAEDVQGWIYWAQEAGLPGVAIAFMKFRGTDVLCTFDPDSTDKAFATPRTWEKAIKYYVDPDMPEHVKMQAMSGAVGMGPAAEFWGFVDVWKDLPDLKAIERDPMHAPIPDEMGARWAVTVSISGAMTPKNVPAFDKYIRRMDPEYGVLAWQLAMRRDETVGGTDEFLAFAEEFRALFARS